MNKEAIFKTADEIVFIERISKFAAVTRQYLKQHYKEINESFLKYINSKTFPKGNTKVPYKELDIKFKEKVWAQFLSELEKKLNPVENQVEDVIDLMKTPTQII